MSDQEKRLANIEAALFGYSGNSWHEIGVFSDGSHFGRLGAMTHLIDSETLRPVSKGYHEIIPQGGGYYFGRIGARTEKFYAPTSG